ncbi:MULTISPECIES: DNA primase [Stenotrophomonas]|uniref:DNA primase n=1 Tax=Stenotrophomonas TaxID=40323 RepID=UPI0022EB8DBD|nr:MULTISPECIES: DNA primase [Stenotrophomonas]MDA3308079.1 DNA primase [Stenotrophomonas sp. PI_27]WGS56824.1 DNA primase [Stenotrophomonas pavanii]
MARIPDAFIDDLLARTDIVEVVGSRVPLKRQGKEYAARCPFHDERSASFTVSPTKQFYHCFGCGAHGTAISFLMNYDRLEFLDAVDELAKRAGMEVPRNENPRSPQQQDDSRELYSALDAAARFFQKNLESSDKARSYLDGRGVDEENRARFQIGYAPDGYSGLRDALGKDERRMKLLDRAGLFSKNDRGHVYDKFRDRVMFPIFDRRGRVIAFGGRVFEKDDGPKYLNSPETALFHKGRELYGLWQVRQANQKIERLIVVEGYMDVVSLFQFGVTQAVATLGTATTPDHAELLFRNAHKAYFCFDGDRAGRSAAWKALESVLPKMREEKEAYFLFLPDGEDPDSIVRSQGKEAFEARLAEAMPISEFYFSQRMQGAQLSSRTGRAAFFDKCKADILRMPDSGFRDIMAARILEMTGQSVFGANSGPVAPARTIQPVAKRSLVRGAIAVLLQQPSLALTLGGQHHFQGLRLPGVELLLELLGLVEQRPDISTGALLEHFDGREEQASLHTLAAQTLPGTEASWTQELHDAVAQLEKQLLVQRLEELLAKQRQQGLDDTDKYELRELLKARAGLRL